MQRRPLGETKMEISVVGFGAWQIGGTGVAQGSMGPADDAESVAAIHRALEHGVNWIDTAPGYGVGHSEEVVARALRGVDGPPYVFTKCGFVWDGSGTLRIDLTERSIRDECEASLRRLEVDALDLYQIHWLEPEDDPYVEEAWGTLATLQAEGKVRHIGVSNFSPGQMRRAQAIAPVETLQPPYSLADRSAEPEILPFCEREGIGVIIYSPMQSGLLSGAMSAERVAALPDKDARRLDPQFQEPLLSRNLALVERLKAVAERHGASPGQVAVAWTLLNSAVDGAIVGFRRPSQVDGVLDSFDTVELREEDLAELAGA